MGGRGDDRVRGLAGRIVMHSLGNGLVTIARNPFLIFRMCGE